MSGIDKQRVDRALRVSRGGLSGDEQGDKKHHGGPEKAVHHYPYEHYRHWRAEIPALAENLGREGAFGENLSIEGLTEENVCIGDVFRLGSARVQVSQARQPCWRLNERFNLPDMARRVQDSGRTGWYYRVLESGWVEPGDEFELLDRTCSSWPLARILRLFYHDTLNLTGLAQLAELAPLSESWRKLAGARSARRAVEDWSRRLETPHDRSEDPPK